MIGTPIKILLFLIFCVGCRTEEKPFEYNEEDFSTGFHLEDVMAPIMPLTEDLYIVQTFTQHHDEANRIEKQYNSHILQNRSFPWLSILSILAILTALLLSKLLPIPPPPQISSLKKTFNELREEALKTINQLPDGLENERYSFYFSQLDHTVRSFFNSIAEQGTFQLTTQELSLNPASLPILPKEMQNKLFDFLRISDKVKFARYHPTKEECFNAAQTARDLILNAQFSNQ